MLCLLLSFGACEETKFDIESYTGDNFFRFNGDAVSVFESSPDPVELPVLYASADGSAGEVDFTITGGTQGVDYELLNASNTLTLNSSNNFAETIRIQPIFNEANESDVRLEVILTNPRGGVIDYPGPDNPNTDIYIVNLLNQCTIIPIGGTYNSLTTGSSTDGCCPDPSVDYASTVTITDNGDGTYTINDFTAGLYLEWYDVYGITSQDQTPATLTITDPNTNAIAISGNEPFGTVISGDGSYDPCTGNLTYTWGNGYGDTGTVLLTLQ